MRRLIFALVCALLLSQNVGCFLPIYSAEQARRTQQLVFTSEGLRDLLDIWERFWFLDMPDHLTPTRVHGGVI